MKDSPAMSQEAQTHTSFCYHPGSVAEGASGYLVDQSKHPDALRLLFEHDPTPVYDLPYIHSEYRELASDGPLVIQPVSARSKEWLHKWLAEGKALVLYGQELTLEATCDHFACLNTVFSPGGESLFRYADPATLASLATSLSPHQRLRILGPLTAIHGCHAGANWSLTKAQPKALPDELWERNPAPLELTQENLASAEAYRRGLLANALAENNGLQKQTVSGWFQQLKTLGATSEQGLVEGAGVLIMRGFTRTLNDGEISTLSKTRQGACWSDVLEALATLPQSQEGT
ncbi:DUF4123 domain-containing protein [Marinobacter sp. 2_MG-2023]|uniref:DUF4123 domain-containing protein n=1 Tax=Marinobacter sp. 2_MG-2023 TaxID=3062679 RepID=UPI0026E277A8|nr:DUF4123 domain-containing protein [Marinobacter sp. 2_MG-2023]MDO6443554.1 DUF4123 domain-containing protein [Marinobacter sp. 2_MG-2023]